MGTTVDAQTGESRALQELRRNVRACLKGLVSEQAEQSEEERPTIAVSQKPDATIQSTVVEIAKAAAYGLERIELLKKRDFPTHKAADAVSTAVEALDAIFNDMLRHPMSYLDEDPVERVKAYEQELAAEESKIGQ